MKVDLRQRLRLSREGRRLAVFLLIVAAILGYLNWQWSAFARRQAAARRERPPADATLVSRPGAPGAAATGGDFYAEARLERDRTRSEERQLLQEILADEKSTPEARAEAQRRLMELTRRAAQETEAESLIRAKGFADSVVFRNDRGAVVVVRARSLGPAEVARIADAAATATGVSLTEVRVIPYDR